MRPWDELERRIAADEGRPTLEEVRRAGIELDPVPPGHHRHGEEVHASDHTHPHHRSGPDDTPAIGIVGAGAVGTALGVGLTRAGWPIAAVASRDPARRERFARVVGPVRAFAEPAAILDEVELILLCVPDDALPRLAGELRLYSGQALVHTSGALGVEVLEPAMAAGTQAGTFHPLVAFADVERAVAALHGATIALEGDEQLVALLARMAEALGGVPVTLRPGSKAAYHAAAVLAAGGLVALLDAIVELGAVAGLDEPAALTVYGRLIEQTLGNARALGVRAALTGPMTRGDVGTLRRHLDALEAHAPDVLPLYRAAADREVALAVSRGSIDAATGDLMRSALRTAAVASTE
ncbi:MAG TPA: DUF2520 domain-containing protein [Candidatus Dormibacteraeota bacterium]|nr:DUF2520 domain-containing protein [Candidatus Dormibacteraeota bacterium]